MIARLAVACCRDRFPELAAMRRTFVIALCLVVSAGALGGAWALLQQARLRRAVVAAALPAAKAVAPMVQAAAAAAPPAAVRAVATTPIPQDAAAIEKRRHDWLAWNRRTLQGAYDEVGKKDARWDEPARKAMELAARMFSREVDPEVTSSDVYTAARAAVDAGCDDPMLLYLYGRSSDGPNYPGQPEAIRRAKVAAQALTASRYPAIRRAVALQVSGNQALSVSDLGDEVRKEAERDFDAVLALLAENVAGDERNEFWEGTWLDNLVELTRGYRTLGVPAEAAYERIDAGLSKVADAKVLRLLYRGHFWFHYGWEARTNAFAPAVPAGGFEALEKRLAIARKALNQAWALEPGLSWAAEALLEIDKGIGGDRANMELWFERAMKANGDNRGACWSKLDWLDPKWYGSEEEMLAFGRACRDTKNWRTGITLLVGDAHLRIAGQRPGMGQVEYMALPEVWADIQPVYDEYLKHHPNDDIARSKFATLCYLGGHFREAEAQYVALGDRLTQWSEFPYVPLEQLKQNRQRTAEILMGRTASAGRLGWHFITGKNSDGQWKGNFPVQPEHTQEAGLFGVKVRNVFTCTADGVSYRIRVQAVPPALRSEGPERVLDAARAAVAEEHKGQPRAVREARLAYRPAQEYQIDAPDLRPKLIRVRTAVIGTRLYELSVTDSEADLDSKDANEFLDSFIFQEQASPARDAGRL
jgi:hypothetical protein